MTIRRIKRTKTLTVKMTEEDFKKVQKINRLGINISELVRSFVNKIHKEIGNPRIGFDLDGYFDKIEEMLGVDNGR
jgi:hypothetical protein